jgi:phospholipase/carboxylesterase
MNRIKLSPLATDTLSETSLESDSIAHHCLDKIAGAALGNFSLFVPMHYEKNYAYPLIVWLHSDGKSAEQVQDVMLKMSMRNYVGVAPQSANGNPEIGYYWDQDFDSIESAHSSVVNAIDQALLRFNVASHRIFLAGMGAGGTMAFRLAFERPDMFAGVMSINGPLPLEQAPLRDWFECRQMPVFWAHGRDSSEFSQETLCEQLRLLHIAGFSVTLRQYPIDNLLCSKTMADMNQWVMETIETAIVDQQP